jgi:hypothetical protein
MLLDHIGKVTFVDLDPMKVEGLLPKVTFTLILLVFWNLDGLPQVAIDVFYPPLRLPVVQLNSQRHSLIVIVDYFVQQSIHLYVIRGLKAREAPFVLKVALKVELLHFQSFDGLRSDHLKFVSFV